MTHLRIGENLIDGIDRPAWHRRRFERLNPFLCRAPQHDSADELDQYVSILYARLIGLKTRIIGSPLQLRNAAEVVKLPVVAHRDDDVSVACRKTLVGDDVWMRIAEPGRGLAADQVVQGLVGEHCDLRIEQRDIDILAFPGAVAMYQRSQNAGNRSEERRVGKE